MNLPSYKIPSDLQNLVRTNQIKVILSQFENRNNTAARQCEKFSTLLHVEELQMCFDIQKYQMEKATLERESSYMTLRVPGLSENRPSLVRGDRLFIRKLTVNGFPENRRYEGFVHRVGLDKVSLKFSAK